MKKGWAHILKGEEVKVEGRLQLGLDAVQTRRQQFKHPEQNGQATARVVESNPESAILEITCCCGTKTYVRCEYVNTTIPAHEPAGNPEKGAAASKMSQQT